MNKKYKVKINKKAVREQLLRSSEMMNVCYELAKQAQSQLKEGYKITQNYGRNRVNVSIGTETGESVKDNAENNSILKALGSVHD